MSHQNPRLHRFLASLVLTGIGLSYTAHSSYGGNIHWTNPDSGFFEADGNWTPKQSPSSADDMVLFGLTGQYTVGVLSDKTLGGALVANGSNVALRVAGGNATDKSISINGDLEIAAASLDIARSSGSQADLNLEVQGEFAIDGDFRLADSATLSSRTSGIGLAFGGLGNATVAGSIEENPTYWGGSELRVGELGEGNLMIEDGGFVNMSEGHVGGGTTGDGNVTVRGIDRFGSSSRWNVGILNLATHGDSAIDVVDGGIVSSLNVWAGTFGNSRINVQGSHANGTPSTLEVRRLLHVGGLADSQVSVESGAHIDAFSVSLSGGQLTVTGADENANPSSMSVESGITVGISSPASVTVDGGASVTTQSATLGFGDSGEIRVRNLLSADHNSTWTTTADMFVGGTRNGSTGTGRFEVGIRGTAEIGQTLKTWPDGTVRLNLGQLTAETIDMTDGGQLELVAGDLAAATFLGDIRNQSARVQVQTVNGNLTNESGVIMPGPDAGSTTVTGDFQQGANGTLSLEIGGLDPGTTHDLVGVGGTAVFGGHLEIKLLDEFVPKPSDEFTLLGADAIVGIFETAATAQRLETAGGEGSFVLHYGVGSAMEDNRLIAYGFLPAGELLGDFNSDGQLDAEDIDRLTDSLGSGDLGFDLVYDAKIDQGDRTFWVEHLKGTYFGDSNLDGEFNSADFVHVFQSAEYEDGIENNSGWSDGDWNGDGEFDSSDFLLAFQAGGYEAGSRAAVAAVPEPATCWLFLLGVAVIFGRPRRA